MSKRKYKTSSARIDIEYGLTPINSLQEYIYNFVKKTGPILISPKGERISSATPSMFNDMPNEHPLMYNPIAKKIAKQKGYLFFPDREVNDKMSQRKFSYADFLEGAHRIIPNINPTRKLREKQYLEIAKGDIEKLEQNSKYLDKVVLKGDFGIVMNNLRLVGNLDANHIDEIKNFSKNVFYDASFRIGFDNFAVLNHNSLDALFHPKIRDESFSQRDFYNIYNAVSHISEREHTIRLNMDFKKDSIKLNFFIYKNGGTASIGEMIPVFSRYVHMINNGFEKITQDKKDKSREEILSLENLMKNL